MELPTVLLQAGLPDTFIDLVGIAGALVLVLILVAMGATAYKHATGGIEWPDEKQADDDAVQRSHDDDDEWEYY